jgi:hypothetical protein
MRPGLWRLIVFFLTHLLCLGLAGGAGQVRAAQGRIPFRIGEKLSYVIKWSAIPVGSAELQVLEGRHETGVPAYLFQVTVRSYPVVDLIYKVRDHIESYADRSMTHALLYKKKQQEGRHKRDIVVRFDWNHSTAQYYSKGVHEKTVTLLPGTFDPLSIFYAFRLTPLRDNLEVEAPVSDGKKCVIGRARVINRERIKVDAGEFDTFLVEPDLQHVGGIFKKGKDAKLHLWVTADERRLVVKAKSKVTVGHFVAELVSAQGVL